jgi:hypothetical protein
MLRSSLRLTSATVLGALAFLAGCRSEGNAVAAPGSTRYEDLITLFAEWRAFQQPKRVDGAPDYRAPAMSEQQQELVSWQARLAAIGPSSWPIPQQVDYHIVRAEMNGLDFDHRVIRPWANNPAFYVTAFGSESDQPAREGPFSAGTVELWSYADPLTPASVATIDSGLRIIPALLDQARTNLSGNGKDLWTFSVGSIRKQGDALRGFMARIPADASQLRATTQAAIDATESFATWIESQLPSRTGPSGIGVANYDWYLKHVMLVPYTWADEVLLMQRELARAWSSLALEERRNAGLPELAPIANATNYTRRFGGAVTEYMAFLKSHDIMTVKDYMDPALRARLGTFSAGPREFFGEVDYRDPEIMRTHGYHWFDKGRLANEPHASPIRRGALLYNIFITRTEGHATNWEEMMLHAGMLDARPRSRELIWILLAERAARALGDLRMHANEFTLEQASEFTAANTPRGWLSLQGDLVRGEQHLYLQQPGYGTSYVIGKIEIEKLLAERRRQLGARFVMREFMDAFEAASPLVPASLLRWELTGELPADVKAMLAR